MSKFAIGTEHYTQDGYVVVLGRDGTKIEVQFKNTGTTRKISYATLRSGNFRDPNRGYIPEPVTSHGKPTIISYSRVSSSKQLSGTGIAQQRDVKVLNQLSSTYGLSVDNRSFSDEGLSGYHSHNLQGEFGRILDLIGSGSIVTGSILAITSLDRLSRAKTNEAMELMLSVINRGIRIYTAIDSKMYSSDSPNLTADLIVSVIIMAQAHEESLKKSKRTKGNALSLIQEHQSGASTSRNSDGMARAIRSVGSLPWWCDVREGFVYLNENKAYLVREIVDMSIRGVGVIKQLEWVNQQDGGKGFTYGTISRLHKRRSLFGEYSLTVDGVQYQLDGYIPPAISEQTYWQYVESKTRRTHSRSSQEQRSLLTGYGVCKCGHCGGSMSGTLKGGKVRLYCVNGIHAKSKCSYWSVTAEPLEQAILANMGWLRRVPPSPVEDKSTGLKLAVEDVQKRLNQVEADYMASPSNILAKVLGQLELEMVQKKDEYDQAIQSEAVAAPFMMNADIPADEHGKRELLRRSFDLIRIFRHAKFKYLVSMYSPSGLNQHIYLDKGEVIKVSPFNHVEFSEEDTLKDHLQFQLWVQQGNLDKWLIGEYETDYFVEQDTVEP